MKTVKEKLKKEKDDPCWDGYVQLGTKTKDGKEVPNCVPMESNRKSFKEFRESLNAVQEETVKKYKAGKGNKLNVEIKKVSGKFQAHIDGEKLDTFNSQKEAEKGVNDFIDLMGV